MVGEGNGVFLIKVWKPLPSGRVLKLRLTAIRNGSKRTISTRGGLDLFVLILPLLVEKLCQHLYKARGKKKNIGPSWFIELFVLRENVEENFIYILSYYMIEILLNSNLCRFVILALQSGYPNSGLTTACQNSRARSGQ